MDETQSDRLSPRQKNVMMFVIFFVVIILPLGYVTKLIPYFFATVNCGNSPIEATSTPGGKYYKLPGDKAYGISMFSDYEFCNEADAVQSGYRHSLLVD